MGRIFEEGSCGGGGGGGGGGVSSEREVLPLTFPTFLEKQLKEICQEKKKARM
jgi:hypothetical protein